MIQLASLNSSVRPYAEYAHRLAHHYGIRPVVTSVSRSWTEQARLRRRFERCLAQYGRVWPTNPDRECRYPANRPGDSAHNWGLAWDSWVPPDQMDLWRRIREHVGFRVPPHDAVHGEVPDWRQLVARVRHRFS